MRELIIDSFAGGGGASTGIEMALGVSPDVAINHDATALAMHAVNHPRTRHLDNNIWKVDPDEVEPGRTIGLLWASPDCTHHSKAKGGVPIRHEKRNSRDLGWIVVLWAQKRRPRVIILENVEEWLHWGPLVAGADGALRPCPDRKGETFKAWVRALRRLGYRVEWRELRACDYGAPTIRKRLYVIARCDGAPIVWPKPTHGGPADPDVIAGRKHAWRTAAEIIDWSLPCPSIFLTPAEAKAIGCRRPLADATMARIAKGVRRYVLESASPFIVRFMGQMSGVSIDTPAPTVTANSYVKKPGGAAPMGLVTPFLAPITHTGAPRTHAADEPLRTVTTAQRGEHALVAPFLVPRYGERPGQEPRSMPLDRPAPVVVPTGNGGSLVAPILSAYYGAGEGDTVRAADPGEPLRTQTTENRHAVVAAHLMTMRNADQPCSGADEPARTVTAGGARATLVAAFLAQNNYQEPGHDAREPVSTIVSKGCTQSVVSAHLLNMKGADRRDGAVYEPAPTQCAGGTHAALVAALLTTYYGTDQDPDLAEPLHTATTKPRFGLVTVTIEGQPYVVTDIGLRMLTPRELFRAQGFPESYVIDRRADGTSITKTDQVRMCGNSVCPPVAAALVGANYQVREVVPEAPAAFAMQAAE